MKEYHLVIIWNSALQYKNNVINIISENFVVVGTIEYQWDTKKAHDNFAAFYGERLDNIDYKVQHCGPGKFLVILIEDTDVQYEERKTSSGKRVVNKRVFDIKQQLRHVTGGGHRIHATDDQEEVRQNLASLFGKTLEEMIPEFVEGTIVYNRDVSGVGGWKSWSEMFQVLNLGTRYVVLRNYETMDINGTELHGDTDIIVEHRKMAETLMLATPKSKNRKRVAYCVNIEGKLYDIDLRYLNDGYYFEDFEIDILDKRVFDEVLQCYIQGEETYAYSLLYHGLVHKEDISDDYLKIFGNIFGTSDKSKLIEMLDEYMKKRKYEYTVPKDWSVYVNSGFFNKIARMSKFRMLYLTVLKWGRKLKGMMK